ncbi:MFS general substrate transporter [Hygrophoropsis aurantiaca]|uniref:MFS general substrate transporter n=1 Tax=Hygrophoropsis aurantiaca TaxID=72124 RepID=A0ACB8AN53_9AGAM|nr:MFS general substrate transporter [Hygrophoropsis aurantiaca]
MVHKPQSNKLSSRRRARLAMTCVSIAANAICAGGVFTFPLMSPALVTHLKLTQPQLTTIALAGMMGQYPFAAVVGKVIDVYGPWACSLVSACLFSTGFGLFSWEISQTPDDILRSSSSVFHRLTAFFFIAGLGTVFSYFSSVFAASKIFPDLIGMASGTSMALFGLSPMFFSIIASNFFSDPDVGLDVMHYLRFLSILCGVVHFIGAFNLVIPSPLEESDIPQSTTDIEESATVGEASALLPRTPNNNIAVQNPRDNDGSIIDLLKDLNFWILAFIVFVVLGSCEMILSNIGTIVLSLPSYSSSMIRASRVPSTDIATSTQVRILSLANTISRLLVGPLADLLSPVICYLPSGMRGFPRKHLISRMVFLTFATFVLVITFAWMIIGVKSQGAVWFLSIGAGISYGCAFTVLPSIVSSVWGLSNLGRNYGVLTYAPFLGTPAFSYLYAFVAANRASEDNICRGPQCWQLTFEWSTAAVLIACFASIYLWRIWRGQV